MSTDLTIEDEAREMAPASSGDAMLAQILSDPERLSALPIETLERLIELRSRMQAEESRRHYLAAFADLQAELRSVVKRKPTDRYRYAPLEDIVRDVGPLLTKHGFSYRFETVHNDGGVLVTCVSQHQGGHTERSDVFIPEVKVPAGNAGQNAGAGITYGRRLSLTNAYGITTADEDTDNREPQSVEPITKDQHADLEALMAEVGADRGRFMVWAKVDDLAMLPAARFNQAVALLERKRAGV